MHTYYEPILIKALYKNVIRRPNLPGLDERTIPEVLNYGASVCVVGGTITRPKNGTSEEAVRKIKKIIYK